MDAALAKPTVGFLGPIASYSHQAVLSVFSEDDWELRPLATITDVFDQVQDGRVPVGVVPFENSSNGCVVVTLDNLADRDGRYKDILVQGEIYVNVNHCLIGKKTQGTGPAPAEAPLQAPNAFQHIKRLYSHPQAFGQCRKFIAANLKGAEVHEVNSTSRAAEMVSQGDADMAAIASELAAARFDGLEILARRIQDRDDNVTRFLIIRNKSKSCTDAPIVSHTIASYARKAQGTKSLVSFTVPHTSPGALADVLGCFKEQKLNLTSINSRPSLQHPFQYVFFVEFDGHKADQDGRVESVLQKMGRVAESSRWLGSWESHR
ncbi:hypothetical protein CDD83_8403 [Cordyceps sp. RAO-2017]|nr:hypothetical protein CDD83_8403 [Cordyceps sp. RAO-2017]